MTGWLNSARDDGYDEDGNCVDCGDSHYRRWCQRWGCNYSMCDTNPHKRVYCPLCGEVTCGMKRQSQWMALPHYRREPREGEHQAEKIPCRGGNVDYEKDKAP